MAVRSSTWRDNKQFSPRIYIALLIAETLPKYQHFPSDVSMLQRDVAHEEGVSCPDLSTSCTRRKYLLRDPRQHMIRRANVSPRDREPHPRWRTSVLPCVVC